MLHVRIFRSPGLELDAKTFKIDLRGTPERSRDRPSASSASSPQQPAEVQWRHPERTEQLERTELKGPGPANKGLAGLTVTGAALANCESCNFSRNSGWPTEP